ncbi:hypothetical protein ABIB62_002720 [Mucilaginibacter sp. UYP25]
MQVVYYNIGIHTLATTKLKVYPTKKALINFDKGFLYCVSFLL